MNIAVVFAGGVGVRMKTNGVPKQFLKVNDKPILVYTLEKFENNPNIDAIVMAGVKEYIDYTWKLVQRYGISKMERIVPGGETGQGSIYNALCAAKEISTSEDDIVLIHDGVRPLIDDALINLNIETVKREGSAITCVECKETVVLLNSEERVESATDRRRSRIARAPLSFYLKDILEVHNQAIRAGNTNTIDSCTLMRMYGKSLAVAIGKSENIKITTPDDYYVFKAILESKSNSDVFS
ncbi:MAG: 2-C-methyl-D-erythritol 4-phosphate cytidylyltransferase [Clostridiales bacterium]|nr:2-C-methyl-D-erythritol 4-phosphate cytidylyltransferase [Clostridiales bacterium]